jgi:PKD repeat protein
VADFSYSCNELDCEFNGGASTDSDGSITAYSWSFGDGGNANGPVMQHTFASAGTYSVNLTVTDDAGATGNRSRSVSITLSNEAPVAGFSYSCNELDCEFNGGASADSDGSITAYSWSFGDGQSAQGVTVAHAFTAAGDYLVRLTVTDDSGMTAARSRTLSPATQSENVAPRADFAVSCSLGHCGFDGRASQDPDGQIASYAWNFGDGRTASSSQPVHEFAKAGTYEITLTVTDDLGMTDSQSQTIEVGKSPITLHVDNSGAGAKTLVVLKWSGAESLSVDLYRDGKLLTRIPNNGLHIDKLRTKKSIKKLSYRLCEQDSDFCSSEVGLQ